VKTKGKVLDDPIQIDWILEDLKQQINCSGTEYNIFLKEKAYLNVVN